MPFRFSMSGAMKSNYDKLSLGIILGLVVPAILMFGYWQLNYPSMTLGKFIEFTSKGQIHIKLISLFTVGNLGVFFLFIWQNLNMAARGVLLSTFLYTLLVVVIKFVL